MMMRRSKKGKERRKKRKAIVFPSQNFPNDATYQNYDSLSTRCSVKKIDIVPVF